MVLLEAHGQMGSAQPATMDIGWLAERAVAWVQRWGCRREKGPCSWVLLEHDVGDRRMSSPSARPLSRQHWQPSRNI